MLKITSIGGIEISQFKGIVRAAQPLGDKLLALWMLLHLLGKKIWDLEVVSWDGGDEGRRAPSDADVVAWQARGLYLLDLGPTKYNADMRNPQAGSACEKVLRDLGLLEVAGVEQVFKASLEWLTPEGKMLAARSMLRFNGQEVDALQALHDACAQPEMLTYFEFALAANRNNATGFLKNPGKLAVFWLLRELANIGASDEEIEGIVLSFFEIFFMARANPVRVADEAEAQLELAPFFTEGDARYLAKSRELFTVANLLRDMWAAGWDVEDVMKWGDWWLKQIQALGALEAAALKAWQEKTHKTLVFLNGRAAQVETDNRLAARVIFKHERRIQVMVVVSSTGNVAIITRGEVNGIDLLGAWLMAREPDRWFVDHRQGGGACLNGAHSQRKVKATEITLEEIRAKVKEFVYFGKPRAERQAEVKPESKSVSRLVSPAVKAYLGRTVKGPRNEDGFVRVATVEGVGVFKSADGTQRVEVPEGKRWDEVFPFQVHGLVLVERKSDGARVYRPKAGGDLMVVPPHESLSRVLDRLAGKMPKPHTVEVVDRPKVLDEYTHPAFRLNMAEDAARDE